MLAALEEAAGEQAWGAQEELMATLVEVTHALLRAFIQANTKDRHNVPDPLRIPRPGDKPRVMSMGQMARVMVGRG